MEEILNQILSTLLNSKKINELPVAASAPPTGKFIFYNTITQRVESISANTLFPQTNAPAKFSFTATAGQIDFDTELTGISFVMVYKGRTALIEGIDYSLAAGIVTLTSPAKENQVITILTH